MKKISIGKESRKYLFEGLLIVFSVLFALFLNNASEDRKIRNQEKLAIEKIEQELERNQATLDYIHQRHLEIKNNLDRIINNPEDSLHRELYSQLYIDWSVVLENKSLVDASLVSTAWDAAKTTNLIAEFDYDLVLNLTMVYELQSIVQDETLFKIFDFLVDTYAADTEDLDKDLIKFQLLMNELTGQQNLLKGMYKQGLEEIRDP